jgi:elongation factor Ts
LELNCETDFAAKSDKFKNLLAEVTEKVLAGETMSEASLGSATSAIGEKIILRRSAVVEKTEGEVFGAYIHLGGKISALVVLTGTNDADLARDVAMQVAASNPQFLTSADVSPEVLAKEKAVYVEQLKQEGKPENMIENIIKGKLNKFYSEVCLMEQSFIKDEDVSMTKYLAGKGAGIAVKSMVRYEVGEGIEKAGCDFAAEVAEQMK